MEYQQPLPEDWHYERTEGTPHYAVLNVQADGQIIYASPTFAALLQRDDAPHTNYFDLFDPNGRLRALLPSMKKGEETRANITYHTPDGSVKRLRLILIPRVDGGFDGMVRDVTGQSKPEVFNQRDLLYQSVVRSLPDISVLLYDHDLRYIIAEGYDLEQSGYHAQDLVGLTLYDVFQGDLAKDHEHLYLSALSGKPYTTVIAFGEQRYLSKSVPIHDEVGDVVAGLIVTENITMRHKMQEDLNYSNARNRTLIQTNPDFVFVISEHGKLIEFDTVHLHGAAQLMIPEPISRANLRDLNLPAQLLNNTLWAIRKALETGDMQTVSYEQQDADGRLLALEARFMAIRQGTGTAQTREVMVIVRDVSELRLSELENIRLYQQTVDQLKELERLHEQLRDMEKIKTQMIHIASHDIRSPLSVIHNSIRDLLDRISTEEDRLRRPAEAIKRSYDEIVSITDNILSLEQIKALSTDTARAPIDLRDAVDRRCRFYRNFTEHKKQTLNVILPETPIYIDGWQALINEAIKNLVGNASKYTPEGGRINVSLHQEDEWAVFLVVDNGIGVRDDQKQYLFKQFSRIEDASTKNIKGHGLGLSLVDYIVKRHNGEIIFDSQYEVGSTFGFRLPLAAHPPAE